MNAAQITGIDVRDSNLSYVGRDQYNYVTNNLISSADSGVLLSTDNVLLLGAREEISEHFRVLILPVYMQHAEHFLDPERHTITCWLSPLNFKASQNEFIQQLQAGTGLWLLESEEFKDWCDGTSETLWCPGDRKSISLDHRGWTSHCFINSWCWKDHSCVRVPV